MTGLRPSERARRLLDYTFAELDPLHVARIIDIPLEHAAAAFVLPEASATEVVEPDSFLALVGTYVQHLFATGLRPTRRLTQERAQVEAVALLERYHRAPREEGYDGALLEAVDHGSEGLRTVLRFLTAALQQNQRQQHARYVLNHLPALYPWEVRVEMTRQFLAHASACFPQEFADAPDRFARFLPELIEQFLAEEAALRHRFGA